MAIPENAKRVARTMCPGCVRYKPRTKGDCPIRKNLLSETRKSGDEERAKFIRNGICIYYENKLV